MRYHIDYVRIAGHLVDILAALGYNKDEILRIGNLIAEHIEAKRAQEGSDSGAKVRQNLRN